MRCTIPYSEDHPFSIHNLPYGSFYTNNDPSTQRCGVAIGDYILDLQALSYTEFFGFDIPPSVFWGRNLNEFMSLDRSSWARLRELLQELLMEGGPIDLKTVVDRGNTIPNPAAQKFLGRPLFVDRLAKDTVMCLPCDIGDYTDFYSSLEHAYNCGSLIRGPEKALQPNWKHLPVAYHGRASSIVPSGTAIHRPIGQILEKPTDTQPIIAPCRRLDFELEVGFVSRTHTPYTLFETFH